MLTRFAAATVVACVALGLAALVVLLAPGVKIEQMAPLLVIWCIAPLVWGLWAMLAPRSWVSKRLPFWGAILGLVAGLLVMFVVNVPSRLAGEALPAARRGVGVAVLVVFYYLLWMLVGRVLAALSAKS